jgi:hypothetical protein
MLHGTASTSASPHEGRHGSHVGLDWVVHCPERKNPALQLLLNVHRVQPCRRGLVELHDAADDGDVTLKNGRYCPAGQEQGKHSAVSVVEEPLHSLPT